MNDMPENRLPEKLLSENSLDEVARLQRILEEASADSAHVAPRDEYGELRETWLAFGRLLDAAEAAQPMQREITMTGIDGRIASQEAESLPVQSRVEPRKKADAARSRIVVLTATAAALCVAVFLSWWLTHGGAAHRIDGGVAERPAVAPIVSVPKAVQNNTPDSENNTSATLQAAESAKLSSWDDAIDTQIAAVSQEIESVQRNWQSGVNDVDMVQYGIDKVSAGLSNDAL